MEDRTKHDVRIQLKLLRLAHRVTNYLCVECGTSEHVLRGLCMECRKLPRYRELLDTEDASEE
jgi:hypothetical protein